MTKEISTQNQTINTLVNSPAIKDKFKEILGKKSAAFVASILQVVSSNDLLKNAEPMSVIRAASIAATLDLPINSNLGFAYIIPYFDKKSGQQVAQFQIGYRGFIQLAMRTGQYKTISATPIYEGQIVSENPLTGYVFNFDKKKSDKIVGFAAFFSLINGFEKTVYLTVEQLKAHGVKYSQTARKGFGLWIDNFDAMAQKTVLKLLLSKYAPLSTEMQTAVVTDQSIVKNVETLDVEYIDNSRPAVDLKGADLTTGLKIKGEKKAIDVKVEKVEETPEIEENSETEPEQTQENDSSEAKTNIAEPLEGEYQCQKCKDISTLTLDGPQECQVCGSKDWKQISEAGKKMAKGMAKVRKAK